MKQYGFYFDSTKCTGCKTCQVSCKDEKDLDLGPKFRRVYEYGGGSWAKQDGIWTQNIYSYYYQFLVTTALTLLAWQVALLARCINVKKTV